MKKVLRLFPMMTMLLLFVLSVFSGQAAAQVPSKLVIISIDSLDPGYLYLNAKGNAGGRPGNWLMPNVRAFIDGGVWFQHTRDYLPSATDMNHLNALAGTSSRQTGVLMVTNQLFDWNADGTPNNVFSSLNWTRDDQGRPVDTLFKAWKRASPESTIMFVSGKEWIEHEFNTADSGIDLFLSGANHPDYISAPEKRSFYNPPGMFPAVPSLWQTIFCEYLYGSSPEKFPSDYWIVDSSLKMMNRERPDFVFMLLAETDDLQHGLGSARNPKDFNLITNIDKNNSFVYQQPILNGMKDVDTQFGKLIAGIRSMPEYRDAVIVLYSDHGHLTHNYTAASNVVFSTNVDNILRDKGVISDEEKSYVNYQALTATSFGQIWFNRATLAERRAVAAQAKTVLENHRVFNPQTGRMECPWYVLDINDMKNGVPGVSAPGELYNPYFADNNEPGTLHWPDITLFMKNGWQLPATAGLANNFGASLPSWLPPLNYFLGGHGSVDTMPIVMAFQGPDVKAGKVMADSTYAKNYRIADIAVTLANMFGLELRSTTVGIDRSTDLK
ncbi:MAG: alkaline phosphatase family protein [Deltaproteobacteria bacterium]|nr:alkaline phosphatase family protein [Deltaproteobacteria bacterium]